MIIKFEKNRFKEDMSKPQLKMIHANHYDKIISKQSKQSINKRKLLLAHTFVRIKMSSMYPNQSIIQNRGSWDKPSPDLPHNYSFRPTFSNSINSCVPMLWNHPTWPLTIQINQQVKPSWSFRIQSAPMYKYRVGLD